MSRDCLIGYSGFVGGNLATRHEFSGLYRGSNIEKIRGEEYDLLICAAPSAAKWKANQEPEVDRAMIDRLADNLSLAKASRAVLLSTVDVYPVTTDVDESFVCDGLENHAYGVNRLYLESRMRAAFDHLHVVRLPGLFGQGLKKNVIFDLIHDNCLPAINSASVFQYYDVSRLWDDLQIILKAEIPLMNLATEPVATQAVLDAFFPGLHVGSQAGNVARYDIRTLYADHFGAREHYRFQAEEVLDQLGRYIKSQQSSSPVAQ
jgi:hypothetical protein